MEIRIHTFGMGDEEEVARRIASEARQSDRISHADLAKRAPAEGQRGIVDVLGTVAVTLIDAGAANFIFDILRPILSVGGSGEGNERVIVLDIPGGGRLELRGGMNDEEFAAQCDRMISLVEKAMAPDAKA